MRTLHVGLRVADPERAVAFYTAVGYEVVGRVPESPSGQLTMLKLPGDDVVSVELVFDPTEADPRKRLFRQPRCAFPGLPRRLGPRYARGLVSTAAVAVEQRQRRRL